MACALAKPERRRNIRLQRWGKREDISSLVARLGRQAIPSSPFLSIANAFLFSIKGPSRAGPRSRSEIMHNCPARHFYANIFTFTCNQSDDCACTWLISRNVSLVLHAAAVQRARSFAIITQYWANVLARRAHTWIGKHCALAGSRVPVCAHSERRRLPKMHALRSPMQR